jgi:hypothetical protein
MEQPNLPHFSPMRRSFKHPPVPADRRWILDDDMELTVWFSESGEPSGFQIVYDRPHDARLFAWSRGFGFAHCSVETGPTEQDLGTPLECARLQHDFFTRSRVIDSGIAIFIDERIREYARGKRWHPGGPSEEIKKRFSA